LIKIGARLLQGGDRFPAIPAVVVLVVLQLIDQLFEPAPNALQVLCASDLAARGWWRGGIVCVCASATFDATRVAATPAAVARKSLRVMIRSTSFVTMLLLKRRQPEEGSRDMPSPTGHRRSRYTRPGYKHHCARV